VEVYSRIEGGEEGVSGWLANRKDIEGLEVVP
jgi:hypothetical protein